MVRASLVVTPESAGWTYSGLRVLELDPGGAHVFASGAEELLVLPLEGGCVVECESRRFELAGRDGVFSAVSDFPRESCPRTTTVIIGTDSRFVTPRSITNTWISRGRCCARSSTRTL